MVSRTQKKERANERKWQECLKEIFTEVDLQTSSDELACEIYVPNAQMKLSKFREMYDKINPKEAMDSKIAIRVNGTYYLFKSMSQLSNDNITKEYLENSYGISPHNIRIRDLKFRLDSAQNHLIFTRSVLIKGQSEWVMHVREIILRTFAANFNKTSGKTILQSVGLTLFQLLTYTSLFILSLLAFLFLFYNPALFPKFLSDLGIKDSEYYEVFLIYLTLAIVIVGALPLLVALAIIKSSECSIIEDYVRSLRNNKMMFFPSVVFIPVVIFELEFVIEILILISNYNFFTGASSQQGGGQKLLSFFLLLEHFILNHGWSILASVIAIIAVVLSVPLFIEWRRRRMDSWADSDLLLK